MTACARPRSAAEANGRARLATSTSGGETPKPLTRKASLHYELGGRPFPLPLVSGTIAGQPVRMLVDTGANSHFIAGWLARKLSLPMKKLGDIGTDHVGTAISTYRIDGIEMAIDDWGTLGATTVLATEVSALYERLGIGAFISPQRLDEEGDAVLLDLAKGEIRSAWWDDARRELSAKGTPLVRPEHGRICEEGDGPVKGLAFVIPATIDAQRVELLLDTGAQHSDVFTTSAAGSELVRGSAASREVMYTASGELTARRRAGARIVTGSFEVTADVDLITGAADGSCPRDGVLAMDVLRSCALLLGRSQMLGRCQRRSR